MSLKAACLGTGLEQFVKVLYLLPCPRSEDPFALSQTLRAACERAAMGQRGLANNRRAQIFADAFLSASCSDADPNSPSESIFCSSPGPAVVWPAQPGAAALMEKLLVLFL